MINQELLTALMEVKELPSEYFETVIVGETVYFVQEFKNTLYYDSMPKTKYDKLIRYIKNNIEDFLFVQIYPEIYEMNFELDKDTWYLIKENRIVFIQPATSKNELSFKLP